MSGRGRTRNGTCIIDAGRGLFHDPAQAGTLACATRDPEHHEQACALLRRHVVDRGVLSQSIRNHCKSNPRMTMRMMDFQRPGNPGASLIMQNTSWSPSPPRQHLPAAHTVLPRFPPAPYPRQCANDIRLAQSGGAPAHRRQMVLPSSASASEIHVEGYEEGATPAGCTRPVGCGGMHGIGG